MFRFVIAYAIYILFSVWTVFGGVVENNAKPKHLTPTASVYAWNQSSTGDWQLSSSWTPERTNPASDDILLFNLGGTTTATNVPTQTIGQLIVSGGSTVNLQALSAIVLTIKGGDGDDLQIAPASTLNFNDLNSITASLAIGATGLINGSVTFSGPARTQHRLLAVDSHAINFNSGSVFTAGQGFSGNPFGTTNLNSVVFDSGSTYIHFAGGDPFGATEPASVVSFKEGSLFSLCGNANKAFFSGRTYANFELNYPGGDPFLEGTSPLVIDDLTLTAGQLHYWMTGTGHRIRGNIMTLPDTRLDMQGTFLGQTISLNGNGPQTITVLGRIGINPANTVAIDNPSGVIVTTAFAAWNLVLIDGVVNVTNDLGLLSVSGNVSRVNGHIIGNLRRTVESLGTYKFDVGTDNGYSPVTVEVTDGHDFFALLQVKATQATEPHITDPSRALSKHWKVAGSQNITGANLIFSYLDPTDIPTTANESNFVIQKYKNGFTQPAGVTDTQANTFGVNSLTDLSVADWTLAELGAQGTPTATATPTVTASPTSTPTNTPTITATATPIGTPCFTAGCLDTTFDLDGMVTTGLGDATGDGVAVQPDGKIVVAGLANRGSNADMAVVRYNSDGSFDTSFGTDGKVTTDFFDSVDYGTAVVIQPDGKIVVAGSASLSSFALARYNTNGSLDFSFDGDGKVTTSIANGTEANDLILQSDGKIIVVGSVNWQAQAALVRYNTDGSLDTSFESDGKVLPAFAGSASSVKLQSDNKIVIGGTISGDFLLARFETDGRTDTSFGSGGLMATDMSGGNSDAGNDLAIQSDGRIVLVGSAGSPARDFAMLRSNADGTLDTTFGSGGRVITEFGLPSSANGVVIQSDGKIVTAGGSGDFSDGNFALSRHNADGSLDMSFGSAGLVTTDFAMQTEYVLGVVLQPDGKIVSAGFTEVDTGIYAFGVARYLAGAEPRTAFDYDGDRKADISVFRPVDGAWYLQQSQAGLFGTLFGFGSDRIAPADYDGDGKTDIAVYRPSTGIWYVFNSGSGTVSYYVFGLAEDLPTPADYDEDGKADVSVFRPSTGTWYRQNSSDGSYTRIQFGASEDKPTVGDFDGDGKSDIAVFRPSTGAWYRINSGDGSIYGELFGFGTDIITPADYDGDGKTDLAAYRPTDGIWYLKYSSNSSYDYKVFGLANDIPAPADFDGDGKADICVFRPSDGNWYRQNSSNGAFVAFQFGANGDKPTMTAFRY